MIVYFGTSEDTMPVSITGFPQSSYVWSARAALATKQIDHDFVALKPGDHKKPDFLARHPFGKVPVADIDGKQLFETSAIVRWADASGSGPSLFPGDALAAAEVEQWISAINAYYYGPIVVDYVLRYALAGEGGPDRAAVEAALPALRERLSILNEKITGPWVAGDQLTAADLFAGPLLLGLTFFPEGKEIIGSNPNLGRLVGALAETPTFMAGAPAQSS